MRLRGRAVVYAGHGSCGCDSHYGYCFAMVAVLDIDKSSWLKSSSFAVVITSSVGASTSVLSFCIASLLVLACPT